MAHGDLNRPEHFAEHGHDIRTSRIDERSGQFLQNPRLPAVEEQPQHLPRLQIVDDRHRGERVRVSPDLEPAAVEQPLAAPLRDLGLEALDDLPLVLQEGEVGQDLGVPAALAVARQPVLHVLRAEVPRGGLEEHGLVEAPPYVLRRVDEVLDAAGDAVDVEPSGVVAGAAAAGGGGGSGGGVGEGEDGGLDGGDVAGDGLAGGLHEDDGVGGVDEVAVAVADQLPELLLLVLDLAPGRGLHIADLRDGLRPEQGLGVLVAAGAGAGGGGRRLDPHGG